MFLSNKYTTIYHAIISNARSKSRVRGNEYFESHHILPRSLGGDNTKANLVLLTAKEHFVCHLLLVRMTEGDARRKMAWAMWNLANVPGNVKQHRYRLSPRSYETVRKLYSEMSKGRKDSEETKRKRSESCKRNPKVMYGEDNPEFKGYYITPWGKFASSYEASEKCPYGIQRKRIPVACNEPNTMIKRQKPITLPKEWIGKTYGELGFSFEHV